EDAHGLAESLPRPLEHRFDGREVGDVGGDTDRLAAGGDDLGGDPVGALGQQVVDDETRAFGGEVEREATPHALAGTRDEGDAAGESEVHAGSRVAVSLLPVAAVNRPSCRAARGRS